MFGNYRRGIRKIHSAHRDIKILSNSKQPIGLKYFTLISHKITVYMRETVLLRIQNSEQKKSLNAHLGIETIFNLACHARNAVTLIRTAYNESCKDRFCFVYREHN